MSNYLIKQDQNGNVIVKKPLTGEAITWEEAFPEYKNIKEIGTNGLQYAFLFCSGLTGSVSFPNLTSIGNNGLQYAFDSCSGLSSVSFPSLTSIGSSGLNGAFFDCSGLTGSVSFPNLTSIGSEGLFHAFVNCSGLKEVHFKASLSGNSECVKSRMGCSNATVYFDL